MSDARKTVVTVQIAGEEFTIRTEATDEYTRECAAFVDSMIRDVLGAAGMIQPHKASILAALAITDQLFRARRDVEALHDAYARRVIRLADEIESASGRPGLATRS